MKNATSFLFIAWLLIACENSQQQPIRELNVSPQNHIKMQKRKVLFVLTSHATKGSTGQPTGFYLSEAAHPWKVLHDQGFEIDFVSPQGGNPPVDGLKLEDPVNKEFWENEEVRTKLQNTLTPEKIDPAHYEGIFYAGGHGTMWDFREDERLQEITARIYEEDGVVAAVCHGPSALVDVKLSDGSYLVDGKHINSFTNEEEEAVGLTDVVPFLLESALKERGAIFEKTENFQEKVIVDGRLVTGQNPASAEKVGEEILKILETKNQLVKD